ncbi:MAG TPA: SRPBCC family protein [Kineosporiaceae bacterium]|nr:SRPBCC family protein [Kineosporiaceae bacterium]
MTDGTTRTTDTQRLGRLEAAGDQWLLIFERRLAHPASRVWRAITEPGRLATWFPTLVDGPWTPGHSLTFRFASGQAPDFTGEVIQMDPPRLLEFRWGADRLRFELRPEPGAEGCLLTLTVTIDELGRGARDAAGWHVCLDALAEHLDAVSGGDLSGADVSGGDVPPSWVAVNARYVERFGPQAATIGPPPGL